MEEKTAAAPEGFLKSGTVGVRNITVHKNAEDIYLVLYDILAVNLSYFLALWIRFDCRFSQIPAAYLRGFLNFAPVYTIFCLFVFRHFKLYRSVWRFASYRELARILSSVAATAVFYILGVPVVLRLTVADAPSRMPLFYYFGGILLETAFLLVPRFGYRFFLLLGDAGTKDKEGTCRRVMLVGAGAAGQVILRDLNNSKESRERVCCIIDDDPSKWRKEIDGIPVVGGREEIPETVKKFGISKILLALPTATAGQKREILDICKETGCDLKSLPGIYQLANGQATAGDLREVSVEELLGREPVKTSLEEVFRYLNGKVILVTGGGGSIGSELCRQIARHEPKQLIIFDIYENNAYDIQMELRRDCPELNLEVLIGSVRDSRRLDHVFGKYRPDVVYHAAAHKHVPLMEDSPCEVIKNNTIGTYKTAYAAMKYGCKRFILISTDKAVNPTNIMGASKRLCEMVVQTFDKLIKEGKETAIPELYTHREEESSYRVDRELLKNHPETEFVAVRFGNVLGSNGSVVPYFKKQIAQGGPVTVTHPDIIRYFMTIPEAVSLVLQAGVYAKGGEIFVLDMGEPVKIDTLARNLIKLSGHRPDVDILVKYIGLRPGEKLYEEKLMDEEGLKTTPNHLIFIGSPVPFNTEKFLGQLEELIDAAYREEGDIRELVSEMVPTYHPKEPVKEVVRKRA